jgi:hypothetical protein
LAGRLVFRTPQNPVGELSGYPLEDRRCAEPSVTVPRDLPALTLDALRVTLD